MPATKRAIWLARFPVVALSALAATQMAVGLIDRRPPNRVERASGLNAGDTVAPILLVRRGPGPPETRRLTIDRVTEQTCSIMIFFRSDSQHARRTAYNWSGISFLVLNGTALPVHWVADERDVGASEFIATFDLPKPWFTYATSVDRRRVGVIASPALYLLAPGGIFVQDVNQQPSKNTRLPDACGTTSPSRDQVP